MAEHFYVTRDPDIMGGKACIRDTQITISAVVALLTGGHQKDEVIQMLPALTREDLTEALAYVSRTVDNPASLRTEPAAPTPRKAPRSTPEATAETVPATAKPAPMTQTGPGPLTGSVSPALPHRMTPMEAVDLSPTSMALEATEASPAEETRSRDEFSNPASKAASRERSQSTPEPEIDESIELFHPAFPDQPTVTVSPEGLYDRRWCTQVIAWPDIQAIERASGRKNIIVTLRHPDRYIAAMPLTKRLGTHLKLMLNVPAFYLDTSSLAIRTKDLYFMATRLWHAHRGVIHFRHKRRVKIGKTSRDSAWEKCLPR